MSMDKDKKNKILITILTICVLALTIFSSVVSSRFGQAGISIGEAVLPLSSMAGCIQAASFLLCVLMVVIDYKKGTKVAYFCLLFMISGCAMAVIKMKQYGSVPGIINCLLQFILVHIISSQLEAIDTAAITDDVTNLQNRLGFERYMEHQIHVHHKGYLVYVHVNNVAAANVRYGRKAGDALLKTVADRLTSVVGKDGKAFKIDGPEYTLFVRESKNIEDILNRIVRTIEERCILDVGESQFSWYLGIRLGVVDNLEDTYSASTMMKNADIAMNYAIGDAKNKICRYSDQIKAEAERKIELENLVKEGLKNDNFYLVYQPQYKAGSKELRGFETLLRMRGRDGKTVSPGEFIPIAEQSDLCLQIDDYVLMRMVNELGDVCRKRIGLTVSVNVSAQGISMVGFAEKVISCIERNGFPASSLEIEITEYSLVDSFAQTLENIHKLRDKGIRIALDDFGSGYTSLAEVLKLPVDLIKIDKSLIDNVTSDETNSDFVKTVIYLGHLMDCEVIAEGVESEDQLAAVKEYNCDLIQGFIWGKPMDYEDALALAQR